MTKRTIADLWGAQAASQLFAAACREHPTASLRITLAHFLDATNPMEALRTE
jgi:hypothetical protein